MSNHSFRLAIVVVVCLTISIQCTDRQRLEQSDDYLPDSLFQYKALTVVSNDSLIRDFDLSSRNYKLKELDSIQVEALLGPVFGKFRFFNAYFYAKQLRIGDFAPVLVFVDMDDARTIYLLNVSRSGAVIAFLGLANDRSDTFVDQNGAETYSEDERYSYFINDSTIRLIEVRSFHADVVSVDSITALYKVAKTGQLLLVDKDSIRH